MYEYYLVENANRKKILELVVKIDNKKEKQCSEILKDAMNKFKLKTVGYIAPKGKFTDLAIRNEGRSTIDISETPCRVDDNAFEFGFEVDAKRSLYSRKLNTYFNIFITISGPILGYLSLCRVLSSEFMYRHF